MMRMRTDGPVVIATTTDATSNGTTTDTPDWLSCLTYYMTFPDMEEIFIPRHVHPHESEGKRERFKPCREMKAREPVFDRKPFLNAYKASRSLGA